MKKNTLNFVLIASLIVASIFTATQTAKATHAMGAEITYKSLGNNTYKITYNFYFDCSSAVVMQPTYPFSLHSTSCGFDSTFTMTRIDSLSFGEVTPVCPSIQTTCTNPNSIWAGVKKFVYEGILDLNAHHCSDFYLSFAMNARNGNINTIVGPGSTSLCVFAMLNDSISLNDNSPSFSNLPVFFPCIGQTFCYNNGATDADGDSLAYEMITPLSGGTYSGNFTQVNYNSGFDALNPVTCSSQPTFDGLSGSICMTPSALDVGVIAYLVKEYRNGVLMGIVERDVEVSVVMCTNNLPHLTGIDSTTVHFATIPPTIPYCFNLYTSDLDVNDTITMTWDSAIAGATFTISAGPHPTGTFCWTPPIYSVNPIPYCFTVTVHDNACPLNGTQTFAYCLTVGNQNCYSHFDLYPDINQLHHYWAANNATGTPPIHYWWSWGDGNYDSIAYPSHVYANAGLYDICLSITDTAGCTSTFCDSSYNIQRTKNTICSVNVINPLTVGLNPVSDNTQFATIFPNPNNGTFTLSYHLSTPDAALKIVDISGRVVYKQSISGTIGKEIIDATALSSGMYFYQLTSAAETWQGKVVVEK